MDKKDKKAGKSSKVVTMKVKKAPKERKPTKAAKEKRSDRVALNTERKKKVNDDANNENQLSPKELNNVAANKKEKPKKSDKEKKIHKLAINPKRKKPVNADATNEDQSAHKELNNLDRSKKKRKIAGKTKRKDLDTIEVTEMEVNLTKTSSVESDHVPSLNDDSVRRNEEKSKKHDKKKVKDHKTARKTKSEEKHSEVGTAEVEEIMSVDEDCSRGMKKWLIEYRECRPGLKILQQRNDDFIAIYEVQQEQERIEREARVAEGGWTVVTHHKGRKKSTDAESGISVGSVAQAALMDKVAKKKTKEIGLDFYRFQRREAQRNDVMRLQTKFEEDKKRIQELRAARKFRPY